ncbi:hypothetical protein BDY24DRAFT_392977 [Mrakia frigida]|uniref:uncharacterized protein n=1 Tax=Mrakia frigida TaxID=29902 RepID=UPI003FCBFF8C
MMKSGSHVLRGLWVTRKKTLLKEGDRREGGAPGRNTGDGSLMNSVRSSGTRPLERERLLW